MDGLTVVVYGLLGIAGFVVALAFLLAMSNSSNKKRGSYRGKKKSNSFGGKKKYQGKKKSSGIW